MFVREPQRRVYGLIESSEQTKYFFATAMIMHVSVIVLSLGSQGLSGKGRQSQHRTDPCNVRDIFSSVVTYLGYFQKESLSLSQPGRPHRGQREQISIVPPGHLSLCRAHFFLGRPCLTILLSPAS